MSIAAAPVGAAEAAAVARRVATLEGLLSKTREASTAGGLEGFAAALQAAGGAPAPEAPEPAEATPPEPGGSSPGLQAGGLAAPVSYEAASASTLGEGQAAATMPAATASAYAGTQGMTPGYPYAGPASYGTSTPISTPSTVSGGAASPSAYDALIEQAAARYGIEPAILHGLIEQESGFNPNARSSAGALGLTQLMPSTAASLGVANPLDPAESIEGGARFLGEMLTRFGGNIRDALAAYNAGPGAVSAYGGVPPYAETEAYVAKVLANAQAYRTGA